MRLQLAAKVFPFEYRFRNDVSLLASQIEPKGATWDETYDAIQWALRHNPNAADLRVNLIKLYAEKDDKDAINREFKILRQLAPNAPLVRQLEAQGLR